MEGGGAGMGAKTLCCMTRRNRVAGRAQNRTLRDSNPQPSALEADALPLRQESSTTLVFQGPAALNFCRYMLFAIRCMPPLALRSPRQLCPLHCMMPTGLRHLIGNCATTGGWPA